MNENLMAALGPYKKEVEKVIEAQGQSSENFFKFLDFATQKHEFTIRPELRHGAQVVIWGNAEGINGLEFVGNLMQQAERQKSELHLIVTGSPINEKIDGVFSASQLADILRKKYHVDPFFRNITVDAASIHTGQQGQIIPTLLRALEAQEVTLVLPIFHMPRFLLTIGYGWQTFIGHLLSEGTKPPKFFPMPFGDWQTQNLSKIIIGKDGTERKATYAELAFADDLKNLKYEHPYTRNQSEVEKIIDGWDKSRELVCHNFSPTEAIKFFNL